jgi:GxxExxY protein
MSTADEISRGGAEARSVGDSSLRVSASPREADEVSRGGAEARNVGDSSLRVSASPREADKVSRGGAETRRDLDEITGAIIDAGMAIHRDLGPGLLESVYEIVLAKILAKRGFVVDRQKSVTFRYDGMEFEDGFRVDLLVDGVVIVELKSVEKLAPVHSKQVLTYLRLMDLRVGLLMNFGAPMLRDGLHRIVNNLQSSASPRLRVNQGVGELTRRREGAEDEP